MGMQLRRWNSLPDVMKTKEVRKYYNIIKRRQGSLKLKRVFDVVVASIMLIFLAIPMLVIAVCIKLDSRGPVFFRQERVTQYGRIFKIYKFRTMVVDAPKLGASVTVDNDSRITRVGRVLRKIRADEFPQLFNILKGDMSIVGPRPALPREVEQYSAYQAQRLFITPGLTCYWQIQPNRNDISFDEWVEMDIQYIRERSFLVDWKIIFKTIIAVLTKQGR